MSIKINDMVVFNTSEVFRSLEKSSYEKYCVKDFKGVFFVVLKGPYEKVYRDTTTMCTHVKIVVDIMRGNRIIESVPKNFLKRI